MIETYLLMTALMAYLLLGIAVNVVVLTTAIGDLRAVVESRMNGPRRVIAFGAVRRKVLRLLVQLGLLVLYALRVVTGTHAGPAITFTVGLLIVTCVNLDAVVDLFDRKMLKWFLRDAYDTYGGHTEEAR